VKAGIRPGDAVAVYGCGPVGLLAAHSALIQGARQVFSVDFHDDRLKLAGSVVASSGSWPLNLNLDDVPASGHQCPTGRSDAPRLGSASSA
jgi:threonine dehydrogenase-like Zn-dependent dehydrogenase